MRHFIQRGGLLFASVVLAFAASITFAYDNSDKQGYGKHTCWLDGNKVCFYDYEENTVRCVNRKYANLYCDSFIT